MVYAEGLFSSKNRAIRLKIFGIRSAHALKLYRVRYGTMWGSPSIKPYIKLALWELGADAQAAHCSPGHQTTQHNVQP